MRQSKYQEQVDSCHLRFAVGEMDGEKPTLGIHGDFVVWFQNGSTRTVQRFGDYLIWRRNR